MSDENTIYASVTYNGGVKYEGNIKSVLAVGGQAGGDDRKDLILKIRELNKLKTIVKKYQDILDNMQIEDLKYKATERVLNINKEQVTQLERSINDMQQLAAQQQASDAQLQQPANEVRKAATTSDPQEDARTTSPSASNANPNSTIVKEPASPATLDATNEAQQPSTNDTNNNTAAVARPELGSTLAVTYIKPPADRITLNATYDGKTYKGDLTRKKQIKEKAYNAFNTAKSSIATTAKKIGPYVEQIGPYVQQKLGRDVVSRKKQINDTLNNDSPNKQDLETMTNNIMTIHSKDATDKDLPGLINEAINKINALTATKVGSSDSNFVNNDNVQLGELRRQLENLNQKNGGKTRRKRRRPRRRATYKYKSK